jgi:hypothetical protein
VVATSTGPTLFANLNGVPNGTQVLTFQAWDTNGVLYRVQYLCISSPRTPLKQAKPGASEAPSLADREKRESWSQDCDGGEIIV